MDLMKALEMAIEHEAEAVRTYKKYADEAEDGETRLLFEQLSREEESHRKRLSERLKALKAL